MEEPAATDGVPAGRFQRPSLASAAAIVAAGFLASRLLGVLRSVAIADSFGDSPELGAYWVAFRLPDLIFQLLAGATLGSAFIPTFARVFTKQSEEAAWRLASSVLNLVFMATIVVAILGFLFAPLLVPAMAPGLSERSLAIELTRIMMLSPILFAASGMFMGILNARHHFLFPAFAPVVYNLAIIVGALAFDSVQALSIAVVVGAGLHLAVQTPALALIGMRYRAIADWRDATVREVGRLMAPRVLGLAAFQFNLLIAIFFASRISDEAISAVNYAWLVLMMPLGLFGMAISTAVFPTMAEQAAGDRDALRRTLEQSLRMILFLTIPAGLALMVLSGPLVALLFQHGFGLFQGGAFSEAATDITQAALIFYAIGLFAHAAIEILSRGFYALGDTRTPVIYAVVAVVANLILSAALVGPLEIKGLALALSLATVIEVTLLFAALRLRLQDLDLRALARSLFRTLLAALLMVEVVGFYLVLLHEAGHLDTNRLLDSTLAVAGATLLGGLVYVMVARALGSEEVETLLSRLPLPARGRP
ncbi:MAG: murein biosynthesis integral membrane protein MurJ [Chloroflexi bacterium]|nr:murein biosynthesis integral membrane protein MurJ [Chloroflexota bacterium]